MAQEDYSTIERPYDSTLDRSEDGLDSSFELTSTSNNSQDSQSESKTINGDSLNDLWVNTWIASRSYKPKTSGFKIFGQEGYIECMKLYVGSGGIIGGSLDIPDTTSSNSFHTDSTGNSWWGCDNADFASDVENANAYVLNTGEARFSNVTLADSVTLEPGSLSSGSELSIQGWQFDAAFTSYNYRRVDWTAGTLRLMDGTTFSISAANTGNMAITASYYIYFDKSSSLTVLKVTTTAASAVGSNKILIAVAKRNPASSTKDAVFQVFGGAGGESTFIYADNIAANTITGNEILANSVNANRITSATITGDRISATARIVAGVGNNVGVLDGANATYRIYAGHNTPTSAPFRVSQAGALVATSATITGTISASTITGSTISGATITGSTLQTGTTGEFVKISTSKIEFFGVGDFSTPSATIRGGTVYPTYTTSRMHIGSVSISKSSGVGYDYVASGVFSGGNIIFDNNNVYINDGDGYGGGTVVSSSPFQVAGLMITTTGNDMVIRNVTSNRDIYFQVNDGGSDTNVAFFDGSTSTFNIMNGHQLRIWSSSMSNYASMERSGSNFIYNNLGITYFRYDGSNRFMIDSSGIRFGSKLSTSDKVISSYVLAKDLAGNTLKIAVIA